MDGDVVAVNFTCPTCGRTEHIEVTPRTLRSFQVIERCEICLNVFAANYEKEECRVVPNNEQP